MKTIKQIAHLIQLILQRAKLKCLIAALQHCKTKEWKRTGRFIAKIITKQ